LYHNFFLKKNTIKSTLLSPKCSLYVKRPRYDQQFDKYSNKKRAAFDTEDPKKMHNA